MTQHQTRFDSYLTHCNSKMTVSYLADLLTYCSCCVVLLPTYRYARV